MSVQSFCFLTFFKKSKKKYALLNMMKKTFKDCPFLFKTSLQFQFQIWISLLYVFIPSNSLLQRVWLPEFCSLWFPNYHWLQSNYYGKMICILFQHKTLIFIFHEETNLIFHLPSPSMLCKKQSSLILWDDFMTGIQMPKKKIGTKPIL